MAPPSLPGRAVRRTMGGPARRLGGRRAARIRIEFPRLLDGRVAGRFDTVANSRDQPRTARLSRSLRRARTGRLARARESVRSLCGAEPGTAAERPELPLAAALAAALRARDLPAHRRT